MSQKELETIGADRAYSHLNLALGNDVKPGAGVTVGALDTGIDKNHPSFANIQVNETLLIGAVDEPVDCTTIEDSDCNSHGTLVSSIIAAERYEDEAQSSQVPPNPQGIAWGADLAVFALPTRPGGGVYSPVTVAGLFDADAGHAALFQYVLDWDDNGRTLDFLNASLSLSGMISEYVNGAQQLSDVYYRNTINALSQEDRNPEDRVVVVFSAGNANGDPCVDQRPYCVDGKVEATSPEFWAGLPVLFRKLQGHIISVVALHTDGVIADFSNRCGIAKAWCLAAPGTGIKTIWPGDGTLVLANFRGTSASAPVVTASLAVMKQFFRGQLSNVDLVDRLLKTADKSGIYQDADIYGQGVVDLGAAVNPVGVLAFVPGSRVDGPGMSTWSSRLHIGSAFGDGIARTLAGREVAVFDELGAPFWRGLGRHLSVSGSPSMRTRIQNFMALKAPARWDAEGRFPSPGRFRSGLLGMPESAKNGHLALVGHAPGFSLAGPGGFSATAFSSAGISRQAPASGVALSWRPPDTPVGLRAGWLAEHKTLLGSSAKGAFGKLTADVAFLGIEGDTEIDGWQLSGSAEIGAVVPDLRGGMVTYMSPLVTSAFSVHATRWLSADDALRFSVSQPVRVEAGQGTLSFPVGRTEGGDVLRQSVWAGLVPTGRQVEVAAHWYRSQTMGGQFRLGAGWTHQQNHREGADPAMTLLAGWRYGF